MPRAVESKHPAHNASSRRLKRSVALSAHNATTGVFTVPGGFLNDLAPGDVVSFSGLTGGSGVSTGVDYHLLGPLIGFALGQTTFTVSATPDGPPLTGGTNATAGTV